MSKNFQGDILISLVKPTNQDRGDFRCPYCEYNNKSTQKESIDKIKEK